MKLTHFKIYFTKGLNALIVRYFYWFWEYIAPLHPEVSPTFVCNDFTNCFTELKRVLQKDFLCALEGFFKIDLPVSRKAI